MITRVSAHYPNSGHTTATLKIVAEDWYNSFKDKLTDRAFVEIITTARRTCKFFPTENDIFDAISNSNYSDCKECTYYDGGKCANLHKEGFDSRQCNSFIKNDKKGRTSWY